MKISQEHYWMGRDARYASDLTDEVQANAAMLLKRVNRLLTAAAKEKVAPGIDKKSGNGVASGWRPKAINDATANAGRQSRHVTGLAIDLRDYPPERALARWCLRNKKRLERIGLWMEDPRWTPSWVHLQAVPPRSGQRVFVPYDSPALAEALPEQRTT